MSSGIAYPPPTYIPPLPVFNPLFFPQSFGTTTTSGGGGGGFTNIFPNGLTSGNVITLDGGTGGGGGTGVERTITGISYLDFVDSAETNPTNITGYITLNGNTLEIGSNTASSGINVNLLGSVVSANGVAIANGGNVSNDISNNFLVGTTQTFSGAIVVNNTQSNIGQLNSNNTNTGLGNGVFSNWTSGVDNSIFGYHSAIALTSGTQNTSVGKSSLFSLTTGYGNTAVGWGSMGAVVSSNYNTAIGNLSAYSLTTGNQNTSIGYQTGGYMTTGSNNVAIGYLSGVDPTAQSLSDTIAIGNFAYAEATGDIILGNSGNYNSTGFPYYAKITPNTTYQGVQIQGSYNNSNNFTINSTGHDINLEGTIINLNGVGSGLTTDGVNVLNGMSINGGTLNTSDKASQPVLGALYCSYYSYFGVPFYAFSDSVGTTTNQQLATTSSLSIYAPLASPALTGTPTSTTPTAGDNSLNIATTEFVATSFAPLASPLFTGTPTAPTPATNDNSTNIATTAFVQSVVGGGSNILFTITATSGAPGPTNGSWDFTLPNGVYPEKFYYYAYLTITPGGGTPPTSPAYSVGTTISGSSPNQNTIIAYGFAVYTCFNTNAVPPVVIPGYGYFFNNISCMGATGFVINTISASNNSTGSTAYKIGTTNFGSSTNFTLVGLSFP